MAFPVPAGVTEGGLTAAGTSVAVTLPAGGASTDEWLILMDIGSTAATLNALTDWTELLDENVANGLKIVRYTGAGVPSNPTFTTSASTRTVWIAYRISGADKTVTPQIASTSTGTSTAPNPPPITPTGGIAKDYLSIAFFGQAGEEADDDTWANTPPTNWTPSPPRQKSGGTSGTNIGGLIASAEREINSGAAIDPGAFGVDVSAAWRAQQILVHPVAASTFERAAAVAAVGAIATAGTFWTVFERAVAVAATASGATAGEVIHVHSRSAAAGATGSIATAGQRDLQRQASAGATGAIATAGQRDLQRSAGASAAGAISTAGQRDLHRASAVTATGQVTVTGLHEHLRAAGLSATGSIDATGQIEGQIVEHERSASLTAAATVATAAIFWSTLERSAQVGASGAISTAGQGILERRAALTAAGAVSATGQRALQRAVTLSASAAIATAGQAVRARVTPALPPVGANLGGVKVETPRLGRYP